MKLSSGFYVTLALSVLLGIADASKGDDLPEFRQCLETCVISTCNSDGIYKGTVYDTYSKHRFDRMPLPLHLSILGWNCENNCDYQCQRIITSEREANGLPVYQFHGKWPFLRVFGIQELFSTLFSIGNFIPNYWGFNTIWRQYTHERKLGNHEFCNLYWAYILVSVISMCAWFFSSVFHLKDTWDRERLDYFFAGMTVLTGFYAVNVRFFHLYRHENSKKRKFLALTCIFMYVCHVSYLLHVWSYTYNMKANVVIGLLQNFLWVALSITQFNKIKKEQLSLLENLKQSDVNWTLTPLLLVLSVSCGMSFELFDFPPKFDLLDAHAMWHFATIWPTMYWFPYMVKDTEGLKTRKFD